ncbi:MAG: hypothetical protein OCD01_02240 [Fibrobacterales bacterium]
MKLLLSILSITLYLTLSSCIVEDDEGNDNSQSPSEVTEAKTDYSEALKEYQEAIESDEDCSSDKCQEAEEELAKTQKKLETVVKNVPYAHSFEFIEEYSIESISDTEVRYNETFAYCIDGREQNDDYNTSANYSIDTNVLTWDTWSCGSYMYHGDNSTIVGEWSYDSLASVVLDADNQWCKEDLIYEMLKTVKETKLLIITDNTLTTKVKKEFNCIYDDFLSNENSEKINCNSWKNVTNGFTTTTSISVHDTYSNDTKTYAYKGHNCSNTEVNTYDQRVARSCSSDSSFEDCYIDLMVEYCTDYPDEGEEWKCSEFCMAYPEVDMCEQSDVAYKKAPSRRLRTKKLFQ